MQCVAHTQSALVLRPEAAWKQFVHKHRRRKKGRRTSVLEMENMCAKQHPVVITGSASVIWVIAPDIIILEASIVVFLAHHSVLCAILLSLYGQLGVWVFDLG